jgi:hypothetical protein
VRAGHPLTKARITKQRLFQFREALASSAAEFAASIEEKTQSLGGN